MPASRRFALTVPARVFEDFTTLNPSYDRRSGGVGLGLAICRRIAHGMGGDIGVVSDLGKGSRFTVSLALPKAVPAEEHPKAVSAQSDLAVSGELSVLVVDDNEINRLVTIEMLGNAGYRAEGANDGYDAVAKADAERFDLILMDISMPGMDGIQATREIRAGDGRSRDATIYALTAHAMEEERQQLAESGMEHFLNKPLRMNALLDALALFRLGEDLETSHGNHHEGALETAPIIDDEIFATLEECISSATLTETLQRFSEEIELAVPDIEAAVEALEFDALGQTSHKLLGSAGLLGATRLARLMDAIETACKSAGEAEIIGLASTVGPIARETLFVLREILESSVEAPSADALSDDS